MKFEKIESLRQSLQIQLDMQKSSKERNIKGQFSTPYTLAKDILIHAKKIFPKNKSVRFLDPAFGTGSFYSALSSVFPIRSVEAAVGYEIDEHYGKPSSILWRDTDLNYCLEDFTQATPPMENEKYNLIICNPPYVRHHHIKDQKAQLQLKSFNAAGIKLSGLSGLYCYFMALAHPWMQKNCIAAWLIPSEFMDVNYGDAIKKYLLNEVTLLQIHRFDPKDVQFDDALVSSAIVWFKNKKPSNNNQVKFTYGGTIDKPECSKDVGVSVLMAEKKWTRFPLSGERLENKAPRLGDFFSVKRGIATGDNKFFVMTKENIKERGLPLEQFRPVLPSPRYLETVEVNADRRGLPDISNQLFVLDCKLPFDEVKHLYPKLYEYLEHGVRVGVSERYLCKSRNVWYSQEERSPSEFYCTYVGRSDSKGKKPFRFILNLSKAIVTNSYLILYPKPHVEQAMKKTPELRRRIFEELSEITGESMLDEGRVYGGGMHKLEPKELSNVPVPNIEQLFIKFL